MDKQELAAKLNNSQYPLRIDKEVASSAKAAGLVIVYGASDDLMEIDGAITDEASAYEGGTIIIDQQGILPDWEQLMEDSPTKDEVRQYFERERQSAVVEAIWEEEGYSFTYKTGIPHVTFEVVEGTEKYCRGIVFSLADLPARDSAAAAATGMTTAPFITCREAREKIAQFTASLPPIEHNYLVIAHSDSEEVRMCADCLDITRRRVVKS